MAGLKAALGRDFWTTGTSAWTEVLFQIVNTLPIEELPEAVRLLWKNSSNLSIHNVMARALQRWIEADPQAALAWALAAEGSPGQKRCLVTDAISIWAQRDPAAAWARAAALGDDVCVAEHFLPTLAAHYGRTTPEKGAEFLDAITDPQLKSLATTLYVSSWAFRSPRAAYDWAVKITDPLLRQDAVAFCISRLADKDFLSALDLVASFPDPRQVAALIQTAGPVDSKEKRQAIEKLVLGGRLTEEMQGAFRVAGRAGDPDRVLPGLPAGAARDAYAAGCVEALLNDTTSHGLSFVTRSVSRSAFEKAWSLIEQMGPGIEREEAVSTYAEARTKKNEAEAAAWIQELPQGLDRDSAIAGYARDTLFDNPDLAFSWVARISDPVNRWRALLEGLQSWRHSNPTAVNAWIRESPHLTAAERERLLRAR